MRLLSAERKESRVRRASQAGVSPTIVLASISRSNRAVCMPQMRPCRQLAAAMVSTRMYSVGVEG